MAYEKQTWKTGDIVTSAKLNHMEDGIASADTLIVGGFSYAEGGVLVGTSDKTWQEIYDALSIGARVIAPVAGDTFIEQLQVSSAYVNDGKYIALFSGDEATTNSADGYPVFSGE